MGGKRQEDLQMKIPALMHLARLGYAYVSPRGLRRDPESNIRTEELREAAARLNGREMPPESFGRMMEELRERMRREDLGEAFCQLIRDGWEGWRLISFTDPAENCFAAVPEMACGREKGAFRPDITLTVNGIPLAMIEVKTRKQNRGIRAEYDRMLERFQRGEARPFLQGMQVWAFSNGRESDEDRLLPDEGACYGTAAWKDFPLHTFRDRRPGSCRTLPPVNRDTEEAIRQDQGLPEKLRGLEARRNASPGTLTHRMLTMLFRPDRFLFLLRYGLHFVQEETAGGNPERRKMLFSEDQLNALWEARSKLRRGYRSWQFRSCGAAGEPALIRGLAEMIREERPESRIYWVAADRGELVRMDAAMKQAGLETGRLGRLRDGQLVLMEPVDNPKKWLEEPKEKAFCGTRVFLLPSPFPGSERSSRFRQKLRRADPGAVMIRFHRSAEPGNGKNYTYLVACADGTLYCGWTNDLEKRVRTHNTGRGARYTRSRRPVRLVYYEAFATREEAMSREWHLKRMSRAEKERLIAGWKEKLAEEGPAEGKLAKKRLTVEKRMVTKPAEKNPDEEKQAEERKKNG